jgi:hypothetical protein
MILLTFYTWLGRLMNVIQRSRLPQWRIILERRVHLQYLFARPEYR